MFRFAARLTATACLALGVLTPVGLSGAGASGATQSQGCGSNASSGMTARTITLAGQANPAPGPGTPITLDDVEITFGIDEAVLAAGLEIRAISAAPDLANLGNLRVEGGGTQPYGDAGIVRVTVGANGGSLKVTGSNTIEGTQTATNAVPFARTFYVTANLDQSNIKVYSSVTNPPPGGSAAPFGADPTRTGTLMPAGLRVSLVLDGRRVGTTTTSGPTVWTPGAPGAVNFTEASTPLPSSNTAPTAADRAAAPLRISATIGNFINVQYACWPGTVSVGTYTPGTPLTFATATPFLPPAHCGIGAGDPLTMRDTGVATMRGGLLTTASLGRTKWKNAGTIENCTGGMPISPKYHQAISGGSFKLQVTVAPGSDCTNIVGGAVTRATLSLTWTTVVGGKARTASHDKIKTGITFTSTAGYPVTINATTPAVAKTGSLFYGRQFALKMVMDETSADVATACASGSGLTVLHFTGSASTLTID